MVTLLFSLAVVFFIGGIVFILRATSAPSEEQLALSAEKENWENIKISLESQVEGLTNEKRESQEKTEEQETHSQSLQEEIHKLQDEQKAKVNSLEEELVSLRKIKEEREQLEKEKNELSSAKTTLEENLKKTADLNKILLEQEKILREELIKNRAQVLGLEKICAEFKIQIEAAAAQTG